MNQTEQNRNTLDQIGSNWIKSRSIRYLNTQAKKNRQIIAKSIFT